MRVANKLKEREPKDKKSVCDQLETEIKEISGASKLAGATLSFQISERILFYLNDLKDDFNHDSEKILFICEGLKYLSIISKVVELKKEESPLHEIDDIYRQIQNFLN